MSRHGVNASLVCSLDYTLENCALHPLLRCLLQARGSWRGPARTSPRDVALSTQIHHELPEDDADIRHGQ